MRKLPIALLITSLTLAACTPAEQQNISDTLTEDQPVQETDSYNENQAEADANTQVYDLTPSSSEPAQQQIQQPDQQQPAETQPAVQAQAEYLAYSPSVLADGRTKVLFFHAGWCPVCRAAEADLQSWYGVGAPGISTYKVDYDAETDLKARYGVTYQHTFVKVDGQGNVVQSIQGPTDEQLQELLRA
jgi:thioredoxin 1